MRFSCSLWPIGRQNFGPKDETSENVSSDLKSDKLWTNLRGFCEISLEDFDLLSSSQQNVTLLIPLFVHSGLSKFPELLLLLNSLLV